MNGIPAKQIQLFKRFIDTHSHFLISGHKEPDGDSIASCLGLAALLKKTGKPYQLLSAGPFKRTEIKKYENLFAKKNTELHITNTKTGLFILDCSETERLGDIFASPSTFDTFIIDHHKTSEIKPESGIVIPEAPATAYLVQCLYEAVIGPMDKETADILFFGICTDTGYFRFLDTNSAPLFTAVSRLVERGANPRQTYSDMMSGKPFNTRKLLGIMLERAEQKFGGKLITTYETLEDTRKYGHDGRDSDSLYQMLLSVENVQAVLFIRQDTDKTCTAGFRSKDSVDVSAVASVFGGGGHKNAAGLSTNGTINELMPKIIQEFGKIL